MPDNNESQFKLSFGTLIAILALVATIWFNIIAKSDKAVSADADINARVTTLESQNVKNDLLNDRVIKLETIVDGRTSAIDKHDIYEKDIKELEKEVALLELQIEELERDGSVSRAEIYDLKVTLSNIVTIIKSKGEL